MPRKVYTPEQIIKQAPGAEVLLSEGNAIGIVCKKRGISDFTYYRWRTSSGQVIISTDLIDGLRTCVFFKLALQSFGFRDNNYRCFNLANNAFSSAERPVGKFTFTVIRRSPWEEYPRCGIPCPTRRKTCSFCVSGGIFKAI